MSGIYPPSKALPQDPGPPDAACARPRKWRELAVKDLFWAGNSVENISQWSGMPLGCLVKILGLGAVVWELYVNGRTMMGIVKLLAGLVNLSDVARIIGGRTRKHQSILGQDETAGSDVIGVLLDALRKGKAA